MSRGLKGWAATAFTAILVACAPAPAPLPLRPVPAGSEITIDARPAPLSSQQPGLDRVGRFVYAGGLQLTSTQTSRLHGLSDLKVWPDGRLLAVSDAGDLLEATLQLDEAGRLRGLAEARLSALDGEDGRPLPALGKDAADAEGIAQLASGQRLVSLERRHRILLYPAGGGPPRRGPAPKADLPANDGLEALAAAPTAGADAYLVGAEASGAIWLCRLASGCVPRGAVPKPPQAGLTALAPTPGGGLAYLLREFDVLSGARVTIRILDAKGSTVDEMQLARPLLVDNFEGLAAVSKADGGLRFYLLSDDNFSAGQRTLLLAFDWTPENGGRSRKKAALGDGLP